MKRKCNSYNKPTKRLKLDMKTIKIATWNICGLRSILKKGNLAEFIAAEKPDFLCLNETMIQTKNIDEIKSQIPDIYHQYYACSTARKGYSGVAIYSLKEPIQVSTQNIDKHDIEGRTLIAEYAKFYLVATYVPNVGAELKRLEYRVEE